MLVTVIYIITLAGAFFMLQRYIRRRRIKESDCSVPGRHIGKSCLIMTMQSCGPIIDKALECLSSNDSIAVCKNHRIGSRNIDLISGKVRQTLTARLARLLSIANICLRLRTRLPKLHVILSLPLTAIFRFHIDVRLRQFAEGLRGCPN